MASIGQIIFWGIIILIFIVGGFIILLLSIAFTRYQSIVESKDTFPVGNITQDIILDCTFDPSSVNGKLAVDATITWTKDGLGGVVYLYQDRAAQLQNQNLQFRNRAELFQNAIAVGNASLLLRNITVEDPGTYRCGVSAPSGHGTVSIQLRVAAYSAPSFTETNNSILTAVANTWFPEPNVTWSDHAGNILNGNTSLFTNYNRISRVLSRLEQPVLLNETYTFLIQNNLVKSVSSATITGTGVLETTSFTFSTSPMLLPKWLSLLISLHPWLCWRL
ncbi:V-set domain-containing T-cell activation inhibitor 1 [Paramormyrops kingsleyae]|uniref:V-set domain-containing T-cell activation inhibitor 1 n=1 Tax=Paramormyrops kingsleyae TaxID=1676925 RepID=UPI000CD65A73|nr:V-set domain-containing T-cell activation inhibitor 1 [Paramormyrops kingsleyae]